MHSHQYNPVLVKPDVVVGFTAFLGKSAMRAKDLALYVFIE